MKNNGASRFNNQRGFTLVEIAIVLVIIGLIIGGVLKGGDLIDGAKMKRLKGDNDGYVAAFYSYFDKYGRLAGDDNTAATRTGPEWVGAANGNGNGLIAGAAEQANAWNHLRRAGVVSGAPAAAVPQSVYGGNINFNSRTMAGWPRAYNVLDVALTAGTIGNDYDIKYDDGVANTGDVQAFPAAGAWPAGATTMVMKIK